MDQPPPAAAAPADPSSAETFSLVATGWSAIACGGFLMLILGYFAVVVIPPMTRPTSYFEGLAKQLAEKAAKPEEPVDERTSNLVIMLEYANADIRAINAQVAFALVGGMALSVFGILLFSIGAKDAIRFSGTSQGWQGRLTATAPGTLTLILGAIVLLVGITRNTSREFSARLVTPTVTGVQASQARLPSATVDQGGDERKKKAEHPTDLPAPERREADATSGPRT